MPIQHSRGGRPSPDRAQRGRATSDRRDPRAGADRSGARGRAADRTQGRSGGYSNRGGSYGGGGYGGNARRDVTEKAEKIIYYNRQNFDQAANDYILTKVLVGTLIAVVIFAVACVLVPLSINMWILCGICFAFWLFYFITGLIKRPYLKRMPYKEASSYWTYEHTQEYKSRNVVLNDFKRAIAETLVDNTTLIDDVQVELTSFDPLIFEFSIRSTKAKRDTVLSTVAKWNAKFECQEGHVTEIGNSAYRVVFPRKGVWDILNGKTVTAADAAGETHEPNVVHNPIALQTNTMEEICLNNASEHTMITGTSGYGKSNMFNMILCNLFPSNAIILFFDKKMGIEASATQDRCWAVTTDEQANAWTKAINLEMERRGAYIQKCAAKKFTTPELAASDPDAIAFSDEFPPIILAVDECREWVSYEGYKPPNQVKELITKISSLGRAVGITLVVASQSPRDSHISQHVKNNVTQKIAFSQDPNYENQAISQDPGNQLIKPSKIPPKIEPAGGGIGQFCFQSGATNGLPIPAKGYYISSKEIKAAAKQYSENKGVNHPVARLAQLEYDKYRQQNPKLPPMVG